MSEDAYRRQIVRLTEERNDARQQLAEAKQQWRLDRLMKAHPASTDHRGRDGYRPVPQSGGIV